MRSAYNSAWWLQWGLRRFFYAAVFVIGFTVLFTSITGSLNWVVGAFVGLVAALLIGPLRVSSGVQPRLKYTKILSFPLDRAFTVMAEDFFATTAKWYGEQNPEATVKIAEQDAPVRDGAHALILATQDDEEYEWRVVVVSYKPQSELAFRVTQTGVFDRETTYYRFAPVPAGTRVELIGELQSDLKSALTQYSWLPRWRIEYKQESARFLALVERDLERLA